jgi:hypothetical protein
VYRSSAGRTIGLLARSSTTVTLLTTMKLTLRSGAPERVLERLLVPPTLTRQSHGRLHPPWNDDFTRVVGVVAVAAVGFFLPSLFIANVPVELWLGYLAAAGTAGVIVGGSFVLLPPGSRAANAAAVLNVCVIAAIGWLLGTYYHQLVLLFVLVVAAHAVVHGIYPGLLAALLGAFLVPYVMQAGQSVNATDPVYALIYLTGAALVPWTAGKLAQRRATALRAQLEVTSSTQRDAVMALARAAEAKDHATGDHVVRVGDIAASLALRSGMSGADAEDLRYAAMLHDVGKLHLPDSVLQKPGALTPDEWEIVKQHTVWGERILGSSAGFELARRVARWHHENFDGSGYPDGLRGESIPLAARIVRIADVFDALSSARPYKDAWSAGRILEEIREGSGSRYDPELAAEMIALFESRILRVPTGDLASTAGVVGSIERRAIVRGVAG